MVARRLFAGGAAALMIVSIAGVAAAQDPREMKIVELHHLCQQGDRRACIKFGMEIEHNRDRSGEWHHSHPDWFWYEHDR